MKTSSKMTTRTEVLKNIVALHRRHLLKFPRVKEDSGNECAMPSLGHKNGFMGANPRDCASYLRKVNSAWTYSTKYKDGFYPLGFMIFKRLNYADLNIFVCLLNPEAYCPKHRLRLFKEIRKALTSISTNELILRYNEFFT